MSVRTIQVLLEVPELQMLVSGLSRGLQQPIPDEERKAIRALLSKLGSKLAEEVVHGTARAVVES